MHNMLNNRTRYFRGSQEGPSKCRGNPCHIFPSICSDSRGFVLMEASKMCLTLAKEHHHRDLLGPWAGGASLSCKSPITWLICRQTMQLLTLICQRWCTSSPSCKRYNTWLKVLCFAQYYPISWTYSKYFALQNITLSWTIWKYFALHNITLSWTFWKYIALHTVVTSQQIVL